MSRVSLQALQRNVFRSQLSTIGPHLRRALQAPVCFRDVDGHIIEETKVRTDTNKEY